MTNAQTVPAADPRRWKALGVLGLIQFMLILDVTVVNVALPKIQNSLHFNPADLAWVVDGYVLAAGGFLLVGGRLADLLGRRLVFLIGVAIFGVASATCGAAVNSQMLVISRFIQGTGEALAAPASLGLIALLFPDPRERVKALGLWGGLAGLGGTSGTVISGFVTQWASWPWIFYINVPVALAALIFVPRLVSESKTPTAHRPDFVGAATGTAGLIGIVYGLLQAADHDWSNPHVWGPIAGGILLLITMLVIEARSSDPLIPASFFKNRTRTTTNFVTLFFSSAFFSYFFLLTLYQQNVLHWTPIHSGLSYLPFGLTIGAGIGIGTGLMPKLGVKRLLSLGFVLSAVGLLLSTSITVSGNYWSEIFPGMVMLALGSGLSFPAMGNAALHQVTGDNSSLASAVQQAVQQVGGALGLATLASLAVRHAKDAVAAAHNAAAFGQGFTDGSIIAYRIGAALLLIGGVLVFAFLEHVIATPVVPGAELAPEPAPEPV